MKHKTFFGFIFPSALAMIFFIALPIVSVITQSLYTEHDRVYKTVENCNPFECTQETIVDVEQTAKLKQQQPLGKFSGLETYLDRNHLASFEVSQILQNSDDLGEFFSNLFNLPFYKALSFTLSYVIIVTPLVIILGFLIALGVNRLHKLVKGPVIFISLLPMIVTPLIGSLVLFWMVDSEGILGAFFQFISGDEDLSLKSSPTLTWIMLFVYGIWHSAPFAFIVFYAGLQTVPKDTIESSMLDGASKWQQIRFVTIPHLMPLVSFVTLIQMMDNFRVFEPIVGFNAEASATSLSWLIYNDLYADGEQLFTSAAATSMLTIIGVAILLIPVLVKNWKEFNIQRANR